MNKLSKNQMESARSIIGSGARELPFSKCWQWLGEDKNPDRVGYPRVRLGRDTYRAQRLSYLLYVGELPKALPGKTVVVSVKCLNPRCVNPDHLTILHLSRGDDLLLEKQLIENNKRKLVM